MIAVLALSTIQYFIAPWLSRTANEVTLHVINIICVGIISLTMKEGISGTPLYIAFALSTVTFSSRNIIAYTLMIVGAIIMLSLEYQGNVGGSVPGRISMAVSLSLFGLYTFLFVGNANRRRRKASRRLQKTELSLLERQKEIQRQRIELLSANAELQHQSTLLDAQLQRATRTTQTLASRRADEDELVRAMHHDLREPLRSMISFNQLVSRRISKHTVNEEIGTFLEFARDAGVRMDRMLADLLTFSTTSTSNALTLLSLENVVIMAKENLSALIDTEAAEVSVSELPQVMGVETQLIQLYQNLIANAIKYAQPGIPAVIKISSTIQSNGKINVVVSDNGLGIPDDEQKRIFDLFSRVENAESNQTGSGVGLALCRRITLAHGANLSVQSEVGIGSSFSVIFPSPETNTNQVDEISAEDQPDPKKKIKQQL
ncbi:MAG: ATP-binding protein [Saprospiraceae bacterium]